MPKNKPQNPSLNGLFSAPQQQFNDEDLEAELYGITGQSKPQKEKPKKGVSPDELKRQIEMALTDQVDDDLDLNDDDLLDELGEILSDEEEDFKPALEECLEFHLSKVKIAKTNNNKPMALFHIQIYTEIKGILESGDFSKMSEDKINQYKNKKFVADSKSSSSTTTTSWSPESKNPPPPTTDLATALSYRIQKLQFDINQFASNASKSRRYKRMLTNHETVLKKVKTGKFKPSDLTDLPNLPGYPLPGHNITPVTSESIQASIADDNSIQMQNEIPQTNNQTNNISKPTPPPRKIPTNDETNETKNWTPASKSSPPPTDNVATAIQYRIDKFTFDYKNCQDNPAKARRTKRNIDSHQAILRKVKAQKICQADIDSLPTLPGYPIPNLISKNCQNLVDESKMTVDKYQNAESPNLINLSAVQNSDPITPSNTSIATSIPNVKPKKDQILKYFNQLKLQLMTAKNNNQVEVIQTLLPKFKGVQELINSCNNNFDSISNESLYKYGLKIDGFEPKTEEKTKNSSLQNKSLPQIPNQTCSSNKNWSVTDGQPPPKTDNMTQALSYYVAKYTKTFTDAQASDNASKARRYKRQLDSVNKIYNKSKAGRLVTQSDIESFPIIPGWPPLPGLSPVNVDLASSVAKALDPNESDSTVSIQNSNNSTQNTSQIKQSTQNNAPTQNMVVAAAVNTNRKLSQNLPSEKNEHQSFLQVLKTRRIEYHNAAIKYKSLGQQNEAMACFKKSKELEIMVNKFQSGVKIDPKRVPPTPSIMKVGLTENGTNRDIRGLSRQLSQNSQTLYKNLLEKYTKQINQCKTYAQSHMESGNVKAAAHLETIAKFFLQESDVIKTKQKNGDSPPPSCISIQKLQVSNTNSSISDDVLQISVLQLNWTGPKTDHNYYYQPRAILDKNDNVDIEKSPVFKEFSEVPRHKFCKSVHLNRNSRAVKRAFASRSIYLDIWQKGSFLRSDTKIATTNHALKPLENECSTISNSKITIRGKIYGNAIVKLELSKPLLSVQLITKDVEFTYLEQHKKAFERLFQVRSVDERLNSSDSGLPKLRCLKVILFDNQMNDKRIALFKQKGQNVDRLESLKKKLIEEYQLTSKWKKEGQDGNTNKMNHYIKCVRGNLETYSEEYKSSLSLMGAKHVDTVSLHRKISVVKTELEELHGNENYI